ncbi:MAG: hypothetical protein V1910_03225 [bacterium]
MSIEFNEETKFNNIYNKSVKKPSSSIMTFMIKKGIVKDENSAKNIMIIISILCFALSVYFIIK